MFTALLLLACGGDKDPVVPPSTDTVDSATEEETTPETWWKDGEEGVLFLRHSRAPNDIGGGELWQGGAVFGSSIDVLSLPWCRNGGPCFAGLPVLDEPLDASIEIDLEGVEFSWNGNGLQVGSVFAPFATVPNSTYAGYDFAEQGFPEKDSLRSVPVSFDGEWGPYERVFTFDDSDSATEPLGLTQPRVGTNLPRGEIDVEWTPGLPGDPFVRIEVETNQGLLHRIVRLTDDGSEVIDTTNSNVSTIWFGRWTVLEDDVRGNTLQILAVQEVGIGRK